MVGDFNAKTGSTVSASGNMSGDMAVKTVKQEADTSEPKTGENLMKTAKMQITASGAPASSSEK